MKLSFKMKVRLSIFVTFAFIIAFVIHEDHAGVVLRKFKPKRISKGVISNNSTKAVLKASKEEISAGKNLTAKADQELLNSSVVYQSKNETMLNASEVLLNSFVVYYAGNETVVNANNILLNSSVVYDVANRATRKSSTFSSEVNVKNSTAIKKFKQQRKVDDVPDEEFSSDSIANNTVEQLNEKGALEPNDLHPESSNLTLKKSQENSIEEKTAHKDISKSNLNKNGHFNQGKNVDENLEPSLVSSKSFSSLKLPTIEPEEKLLKADTNSNLEVDLKSETILNRTNLVESHFKEAAKENQPEDKDTDLTSILNKTDLRKSANKTHENLSENKDTNLTNESILKETDFRESAKKTDENSAEDKDTDLSNESILNKTDFRESANETDENLSEDKDTNPKNDSILNKTNFIDTNFQKSANETEEKLSKKDVNANLIGNETNETGIESIVTAGLDFLTNSEVAKSAMEILSDPSLTDHIIEEGVIEDTGFSKKCPTPGICVFWFMAQNICNSDDECLGTKICCRVRCSKQCIDV